MKLRFQRLPKRTVEGGRSKVFLELTRPQVPSPRSWKGEGTVGSRFQEKLARGSAYVPSLTAVSLPGCESWPRAFDAIRRRAGASGKFAARRPAQLKEQLRLPAQLPNLARETGAGWWASQAGSPASLASGPVWAYRANAVPAREATYVRGCLRSGRSLSRLIASD